MNLNLLFQGIHVLSLHCPHNVVGRCKYLDVALQAGGKFRIWSGC